MSVRLYDTIGTGTIGPRETVPLNSADVAHNGFMGTQTVHLPFGEPRTFSHILNEWVMTEMLKDANEEPSENHASLVRDLVVALRESEETRADPIRTPKILFSFVGLIVTGLLYAGIIWAKVSALESKMSAVDSINVVAAQVSSLQQQMRSENERLQASQARLEDRMEKFIEQQMRRDKQ